MGSYNWLRCVCRLVGVLLCVLTIAAIISDRKTVAITGGVLLAADVIVLAVKNRCPYCHKMLRIGLIDGEEYCPYCGGEIR